MPRDFVPCEYTERELTTFVTDDTVKRCQVIECFAGSSIVTRDPLFIMSLNSHAHFIDTDTDDTRAREHLFGIFYAAMADLE